MTSPIFDKPEWFLKTPPKGTNPPDDVTIEVTISGNPGGTEYGKVTLIPGPQMLTYLRDRHGFTSLKGPIGYYLEQEGDRWYFGMMLDTIDHDFWYYTKSTLPEWAKEVIK